LDATNLQETPRKLIWTRATDRKRRQKKVGRDQKTGNAARINLDASNRQETAAEESWARPKNRKRRKN
jgi:hypothetical protein